MSVSSTSRGRAATVAGGATGTADLPLHGGRVPPWLFERMARLGRVLAEAIVHAYGRDELLRRLSHPFWFQSLGALMGMDWHSSGITTSVVGALQRGLAPLERELGLRVCGGRGRHSRRTPDELAALESVIAGLLGELGYQRASADLSDARMSLERCLYRANHGARTWLKRKTPLGRLLTNTALLVDGFGGPKQHAAGASQA